MSSEDAVVALSDATERLTYAALTKDPDTLKAAYEALLRADQADSDSAGPNEGVRRAVVEMDPVTAAGLGWLTMQDLGRHVREEPSRFLNSKEAKVYRSGGVGALRLIVRCRVSGESLSSLVAQDRNLSVTHTLAARGNADDADKVRRLLARNGLIDEDN